MGLVFPYRDRPERPWPRFWHALAAEAECLERDGVAFKFWYGNETHQDVESYLELLGDVKAHRVGGLIFATSPFYLAGSPVLESAGIARVALAAEPTPRYSVVTLDGDWIGLALDRLGAMGRRRIAVLGQTSVEGHIRDVLAHKGINVPPYWVQTLMPDGAQSARSLVHLLMSGPAGERPDGLLIMDDNFVEPATAGLLDGGVAVPGDVTVVAHANLPHLPRAHVPVEWLGYDVRRALEACLDLLGAMTAGREVASAVEVAPRWVSAAAVKGGGTEPPAGFEAGREVRGTPIVEVLS